MKQGIIATLLTEIDNYIDLGNDAIKRGCEHESMQWYRKGLSLSVEAKNKVKEREISALLITLM
jgi:hypothetical protein